MKKLLLFACIVSMVSLTPVFGRDHVQEFSLIARQYDFEPEVLTVKAGIPVKIYATSIDVDHGFSIIGLGVSSGKIEKGKITTVTFTPEKTGEFDIECDVMCGSNHHRMKSKLVVVEE